MNYLSRLQFPCLLLALLLCTTPAFASSEQINLSFPETVQQGHAFALSIKVQAATLNKAQATTSNETNAATLNEANATTLNETNAATLNEANAATLNEANASIPNKTNAATAPTVTITWNGRTFPVSLTKGDDATVHRDGAIAQGNGAIAQGNDAIAAELLLAELLLPMPYDAKLEQELLVSYEDVRVQSRIKPQIVDWTKATIKLDPKYVVAPASVTARTKKERAQAQAVIQHISPKKLYGSIPFARPVKGIITSPYGTQRVINGETRSIHKGLDFRGATGVSVRAIADGIVALSEDFYYSGNTVFIDHGLGLISQYAHLSQSKVKEGDIIKAGELLGLIGATGRVTGPHLHLVIYDMGVSINPLPFFATKNKK